MDLFSIVAQRERFIVLARHARQFQAALPGFRHQSQDRLQVAGARGGGRPARAGRSLACAAPAGARASAAVARTGLALRRRHPQWGAKKLQALLAAPKGRAGGLGCARSSAG